MSKGDIAKELFESGCNCSQAVFCAFCNETGFDKETALRVSAGFGGGFGRLREVCGAVSGMTMVLSCKLASTDIGDSSKKAELYAIIQKAANEFRAQNGSIICRELLGLSEKNSSPVPEERNAKYYAKRPCSEIVRCAAEITERVIDDCYRKVEEEIASKFKESNSRNYEQAK